MNIFRKILSFFVTPEIKSGALVDTRTAGETSKDFKFEETVAKADKVEWVEKTEYRKFPIFSQNGSYSCVAQSLAKLLGILHSLTNRGVYVHFSATDIYQRRLNRPDAGMHAIDAFKIAQGGVTLEDLVPSENMTDTQMDNYKIEDYQRKVGEVFKLHSFLTVQPTNIDTIASIIQRTGKGVMVWFYFMGNEWTPVPFITKHVSGRQYLRHSVVATDFMIHNGKKVLVIEDSWGIEHGMGGRRLITENFFRTRNIYAGYPMQFVFEKSFIKIDRFTTPVEFSTTVKYIEEVRKIQNFLKQKGHFPRNIESTGYYGSITARAVLAWQLENCTKFYSVNTRYDKEGLSKLQGRYWGNTSIKIANL